MDLVRSLSWPLISRKGHAPAPCLVSPKTPKASVQDSTGASWGVRVEGTGLRLLSARPAAEESEHLQDCYVCASRRRKVERSSDSGESRSKSSRRLLLTQLP